MPKGSQGHQPYGLNGTANDLPRQTLMSTKRARPKAKPVKVKLPEWIMGGDPQKIADVCGWTVEATEEPGLWLMGSKEGIHGTNGNLLRISKLADRKNGHLAGAYTRMHRLKRYDGIAGDDLWNVAMNAHSRLVKLYPEESATMLISMRMLISASRTASEAASMTQRTFTEYLLPVADNPSVYLVEISDALGYRYTAARTLLATGDEITAETFKATNMISRSSRGLFSDTSMGFDAYFACMCASLSPLVWAYPIGRPGGVVLLLFGDAMAGKESLARDKIQLLAPDRLRAENHPLPTSSPEIYIRAANWWVNQLSTLFSIITEPANYVDDELYDPAEATERLLSVEQMFRDCQSILTQTRDDHARTTLTFTFLKRLEGLIPGYKWKAVVGRNALEDIVEKLRTDVPIELHDVFVRRAERAVRAVKSLENGFFAAGEDTASPVVLPDKNGARVPTERRNAVTEWLQLVRNSLHGFDQQPSKRDRALLAAHDGVIPGDFADVAWLHILDLVAHPEKLAKFELLRKISENKTRRTKQA